MVSKYTHTQRGPWQYFLLAVCAIMIVIAWSARAEPQAIFILILVAAVFFLLGGIFGQMTVTDEGEHLLIEFGPVTVFRKRIPYTEIRSCEIGKSAIIDGWGIHWVPYRGWTYNIWGFDCVVLQTATRTIRVGSDDVENLAKIIETKINSGK